MSWPQHFCSQVLLFGRGGLGFQVRNLISLKIRRVLGLLLIKSYLGRHTSSRWCGTEVLERGCQLMSSSSSNSGSEVRGPSQNSPLVAAKRDVNMTKLNSQVLLYVPHERFGILLTVLVHFGLRRIK
ncbi:hypothetical protein AVEN_272802-1 [Araneus ventricosus]|uniref:Uncharacterized protein n=1 Tax=Araneus ventricosus TaxID=182803 RepID=A0A4Y2HAE7_ARAVE|nr:hypothetical protein AVEN_272802-1 [Araneus ventricosus]